MRVLAGPSWPAGQTQLYTIHARETEDRYGSRNRCYLDFPNCLPEFGNTAGAACEKVYFSGSDWAYR